MLLHEWFAQATERGMPRPQLAVVCPECLKPIPTNEASRANPAHCQHEVISMRDSLAVHGIDGDAMAINDGARYD